MMADNITPEERRNVLKRLVALRDFAHDLYDLAGQPYGDSPEGFQRWLQEAAARSKGAGDGDAPLA